MVSSINNYEFMCLSSDTKPTAATATGLGYTYIPNGATLLEMDTGKVYAYDADNATWREI